MKTFVLATAAATALSIGAPALALAQDAPGATTDTGAYANLGWSHLSTNGVNNEGIQGRLGYRFMPFLGVEGELRGGLTTGHNNYSVTTGTPPVTSTATFGVKQSIAGSGYVVGFVPLMSNRFDLLARVGYGWSRYNLSTGGAVIGHANEHGIRYGAGAQYLFDGANGVRVDWTRENMNNWSVPNGSGLNNHADVWGVSFVHKF